MGGFGGADAFALAKDFSEGGCSIAVAFLLDAGLHGAGADNRRPDSESQRCGEHEACRHRQHVSEAQHVHVFQPRFLASM